MLFKRRFRRLNIGRKSGVAEENKYTARHQLLRLPILVLLAAAGMFAPKLLSSCPQQTERIYSRAIYPVISRVLGAASSIFPFSVAEVLIISVGALLTVTLVVRLFKLVFSKLLKRKHNRMRFYSCLISLGMFAGAMLNLFYALWGINHYRMPAASLLGLSDKKYGICRICFRELAYKGQIPGVKKSSW